MQVRRCSPPRATSALGLTQSSVVYPNVHPDVLALEVKMIESKSFATARSRGNYFINVSTYIESHKERLDGSQYVQRIPKFTRQEETSRRARVRERIIAGEEKLDQHGNGPRHPQAVAPPNVNSASQAQPVGLSVSHDRLQTLERTQNVPQINDSFPNLTPPFETRPCNHALPVSKPTMPLSRDPLGKFANTRKSASARKSVSARIE